MSTENNKDGENKNAAPEDLSKLKETVTGLQKTNTQILEAINAMKTAAAAKPPPKKEETAAKKDLKEVWFDDQEAAATIIEERAEQRVQKLLQQQQQAMQQTQNTMRGLYKDFPELQDLDHPLTQKAIDIFEKLSDTEKQSPLAYKLSVKEAADELEIKPKTKRKTVDDDDDAFSLGGNHGRSPEAPRNRKATKLDPRTVEFAKMMGLNMDDPKVVESLTKRAQRDTWLKYR